jgi:hypothetical protein
LDARDEKPAGDAGRLVMARSALDGREMFRVALPLESFNALPIEECDGLFVVQGYRFPDKSQALLIDRTGKVRRRLDTQVLGAAQRGNDLVVHTKNDLVRLSAHGDALWSVQMSDDDWFGGGGLVSMRGGDLLAFRYEPMSDSGVDVVRIEPTAGKTVWKTHCKSLGVDHSKYSHRAKLTIEPTTVRVTSEASGGCFFEVLDMRDGRQLSRVLYDCDYEP